MKFKGTAALFGLLIVLAGWVYFTEIRGREERERADAEAGLAFPGDYENIRRIRLAYPDHAIEAVRENDVWTMTSPAGTDADTAAWELLASNVPRIEREETVRTDAGSTDLSAFGLEVPILGVRVELEDGRSDEILFGSQNPVGTHYYATLASAGDVFLAPESWLTTVRKELDDLRDKTILHFEQDSIDRIQISGSSTLSLVRDGAEWALEQPLAAAAALAEVDTFLGGVAFARAVGFADDVTAEAAGMGNPRVRIALHNSSSDQQHVLLIGRQPEDRPDRYFAKDDSRDTVFLIDGDIVEKAEQPIFQWRDKTIATFDRPSISAVRLERPDGRLVLTMGESGWELEGGSAVPVEIMSGMFNAVEFDRIADIVDAPGPLANYGLDSPRLRVVFEAAGDEVLAFGFGGLTSDGEHLYWKSEAENEVKVVSLDVFDRFDVTREGLLELGEPEAP